MDERPALVSTKAGFFLPRYSGNKKENLAD
jgi:hypothetical protein